MVRFVIFHLCCDSFPLMFVNADAQPLPKLDTSVIDLYKGYKAINSRSSFLIKKESWDILLS